MTCVASNCLEEPQPSCYDGYCPEHCASRHGATCNDIDDDYSDLDTEFGGAILQGLG